MDTTAGGARGGGEGSNGTVSQPGPTPDASHIIIEYLQRENEKLRERAKKSQLVEITGKNGSPVYARGSFQERRLMPMYRRDDGWRVYPLMLSERVPISAMQDLEIRLGGALLVSAIANKAIAKKSARYWDHEMGKELICGFSPGVQLDLRISGWPRTHWSEMATQEILSYHPLREQISHLFPSATLAFKSVTFAACCVGQMLRNNDLDQLSNTEKGENNTECRIINLICHLLREAGKNEEGDTLDFSRRVRILQTTAYMFRSYAMAIPEIPSLVQMQLASQSPGEFISQVKERYEGMLKLDTA